MTHTDRCLAHLSFTVGPLVVLLTLLTFPLQSHAQGTYTWNVASGNFSQASSWSPTRTLADPEDVLVFNGSVISAANIILDPAVNINAGQLRFINGIDARLSVPSVDCTIIVNGGASDDFVVAAGATVRFGSTTRNDELTVNLVTSGENGPATAAIAGTLIFENTAPGSGNRISDHRLVGGTGSVVFANGSTLRLAEGAEGNPFGNPGAGAIATFQAGATLVQEDGASPFGTGATPAAIFQSGSIYRYASINGNLDASGRTYGNLVIDIPQTVVLSINGAGQLTVLNSLRLPTTNLATLAMNLTGGVAIGRDIEVVGGGLTFTPPTPANLTFNGAILQAVRGVGVLTIGNDVTVVINNAAGVMLERPLMVPNALNLLNGRLFTTATNILSIPFSGVITASSAGFVDGPMARTINTVNTTTLTFPFGTDSHYRPLTLVVKHSNTANTIYTAQMLPGAPTARTYTGDIKRVSRVRHFTVESSQPNLESGTVTIEYGPDDEVDAPAKLRIAQSSGAAWVSLGGVGTAAPSGTITSTVPMTTFTATFVLASTEVSRDPGNNPLPVELKYFTATRQEKGSALTWETASEKNSASFEVQRSLDGGLFTTFATLEAGGSSSIPRRYAWFDADAPSGILYYRLRQIDLDGTVAHSPIAVVGGKTGLVPLLYPNPTSELLTLETGSTAQWWVRNTLGQVLLQGTAVSTITLNVANLAAGVYYVETRTGACRHVQKLVKQ
ncbi:T9SS type A sorting domain-containing protein [Hymenobacter koreensis]|uniref:T9SS type A sorting domain-containing protein n=1 Tax=Hymenobacter koreensis TaxID=1084523 RepID=A0ABP8J337_9BACT